MIDQRVDEVFVITKHIKDDTGKFGPLELVAVRAVWAEADDEVEYGNDNYDNEYWAYHRVPYTYYVDLKTGVKYTDYAHPTEEELIDYEDGERS